MIKELIENTVNEAKGFDFQAFIDLVEESESWLGQEYLDAIEPLVLIIPDTNQTSISTSDVIIDIIEPILNNHYTTCVVLTDRTIVYNIKDIKKIEKAIQKVTARNS